LKAIILDFVKFGNKVHFLNQTFTDYSNICWWSNGHTVRVEKHYVLHGVINSFSPSKVKPRVKCFIIKKLCILLETITKKFYNMVHWKVMLFNWNRSENWSKHFDSGGRVKFRMRCNWLFLLEQEMRCGACENVVVFVSLSPILSWPQDFSRCRD